MSVESRPNKLTKGLVLDTFHTDVDNTVATYALNSQLEDQEGNHFHYGSEVGTTFIKDIPDKHVVVGHINMERNETVLFTTDGTNSTIGILSRKDDMSYHYEIKVDDSKQTKKLGFKKEGYVRGVYRLLNGCDKVIYFVDGVNKDRRININQLDSYKLPTTASVASGIIFDDSLRATIYALSSATGNIQLIRLMSASPEATANVLANLSSGAELTKLLTASANGIGTALANLIRTANIVSSIEATGTSTVNVDIVRLLQSNVSAIGSVNAILEASQQGVVEIDVTLSGVASSTAILLRAALLEVNLTTEATTLANAILTRIINAQVQALANTESSAQISIPVNATVDATATTAANAILSYAVNATVDAMAQTSATAQLSKVISASVDALADSSSELLIGLVLVSTNIAGSSASTADLYINRLLSSSVTAEGTTTVEALIAKLLESSTSASANNTTTDLLVSKLLASTVDGLANTTANLQLADLLSTSLSGTATADNLLEIVSIILADPYIDNVSLLLQGDDNPASVTQNNTFIDSSALPLTITRNGNVTQGTFSPFDRALTNSGGSAYFDGTTDWIQTPNNVIHNLGSSDFTIEFWMYVAVNPSVAAGLITKATHTPSTGYSILYYPGYVAFVQGSTLLIQSTAASISTTKWNHIAVTRSGTSGKIFINGTQSGSAGTINNFTDSSTVLAIGALDTSTGWNGNFGFNGYISNLRIVKGTAVYTTNFNPSTIPLTAITNTSLLLNFINAAIFDGVKLNNVETVGNVQINTSIKKYGTGSLSFSGTTSFLKLNNQLLAFGNNDFTIELWYNPITASNSTPAFLDFRPANTDGAYIHFGLDTSNRIVLYVNSTYRIISTSTMTNNTWNHLVLCRNGASTRIYLNGQQQGSTWSDSTNYLVGVNRPYIGANANIENSTNCLNGYIDDLRITKGIARYTSNFTPPTSKLSSLIPNYLVSRSLRFNSADSTYLNRTPTVAGNRKTWTWSGWVKRGSFGSFQRFFAVRNDINDESAGLRFDSSDRFDFIFQQDDSSLITGRLVTTQVFRDPSAWYHIVFTQDTTNATPENRLRLWINGVEVTVFTTDTAPTQNHDGYINSTNLHRIGSESHGTSQTFNGYLAEINFIDGQALTPDSFGVRNTSTGVWSPKEYTGTYGTNGFHLNFSDITQIGRDFSGNNNNWTPNNFSVTPGVGYDSLTDVPTPNGTDNGFGGEVRGNYATLNPLNSSGGALSNGNLDYTMTNNRIASNMAMISGSWYCEVRINTSSGAVSEYAITINGANFYQPNAFASGFASVAYYAVNGNKYVDGTSSTYGLSFGVGDVIGLAVNATTGVVNFYKNNSNQGPITLPLSPNGWVLGLQATSSATNATFSVNFGQRPFVYPIPTGFKTLNTANLPTPAIGGGGESNLANKYMDITTYTGTGTAQSIFNSGFKPDFVWIKSRSAATGHAIYDINRGVNKQLASNSDALEVTNASGLTSFDNTGFSIGTLADINTSGATYVAWQWRADGTPLTTAAGNTISSSVSVNSLSKFSITTYTGNGIAGATIAHALGVIPRMVIIKSITGAVSNWAVYHGSLGNTSSLFLNTNGVSLTSNTYWNNTNPTANLISLGTSDLVNANTRNYVAYAWAEIDGYSKFSSYVGNNSTDGTFVYTGFKPKYILIKCSTAATTNWVLYNSIVNTGNPVVNELFANTTNAENGTTGDEIDFLSNGFKLRSTNAAINAAQTYVYAAFAETPFKYATAALTPEVKETVEVDYLVVAGGGGGGVGRGGGGGAGGLRSTVTNTGGNASLESALIKNKNTNILVTVGGGGATPTSNTSRGSNGSDSVFDTITSYGGGAGGNQDFGATNQTIGNAGSTGRSTGFAGGSGGGSGGRGEAYSGGNGTSTQGFLGGSSTGISTFPAGGGGGAGQAGANAVSGTTCGNGGNGLAVSISGSSVTYAGGGGGAAFGLTLGTGGNGGGGDGKSSGGGDPGEINKGAGGGGGTDTTAQGNVNAGAGGSGIVIISYSDTNGNVIIPNTLEFLNSSGSKVAGTGVAVAPTRIVNNKKIYEFLEGSGNIQIT